MRVSHEKNQRLQLPFNHQRKQLGVEIVIAIIERQQDTTLNVRSGNPLFRTGAGSTGQSQPVQVAAELGWAEVVASFFSRLRLGETVKHESAPGFAGEFPQSVRGETSMANTLPVTYSSLHA